MYCHTFLSLSVLLFLATWQQLLAGQALCFRAGVYLFFLLPPNIGGLWADRHQTLPHVSMMTVI